MVAEALVEKACHTKDAVHQLACSFRGDEIEQRGRGGGEGGRRAGGQGVHGYGCHDCYSAYSDP